MSRKVSIILAFAALVVCMPFPVRAGCAAAETPDWSDVSYLRVESSHAAGGAGLPQFQLIMERRRSGWIVNLHHAYDAPFKHGTYTSDDPEKLFNQLLGELRQKDFFTMRLVPANKIYIDGLEQTIALARCGVRTSLSNAQPGAFGMSPEGKEAQAFLDLASQLRTLIYAASWRKLSDDYTFTRP
ncbi:MAG: hypothetical protein JO043_11705 [Candidatus Eremiobacteraeota bacterium]|nr:hypothetical protein [Candidatus Eremiobacteraeota bacterium]